LALKKIRHQLSVKANGLNGQRQSKGKTCYGPQSVVVDEEPERRLKTGRGAWDEGRNEMRWRCSCQAENDSEWQMAIGD